MPVYPLSPSYATQATPRPLATPVLRLPGLGDGRVSHLAALAAAVSTPITRSSCKWRRRYSTGSALARAASSSMKLSCAKVFCRRAGERRGPVQNGDATLCTSTFSLLTVPVPPFDPPTRPATYEGIPLLLLL